MGGLGSWGFSSLGSFGVEASLAFQQQWFALIATVTFLLLFELERCKCQRFHSIQHYWFKFVHYCWPITTVIHLLNYCLNFSWRTLKPPLVWLYFDTAIDLHRRCRVQNWCQLVKLEHISLIERTDLFSIEKTTLLFSRNHHLYGLKEISCPRHSLLVVERPGFYLSNDNCYLDHFTQWLVSDS